MGSTMARPLSIPNSPNEITAAWLSDALTKSFPGVEVARVEVIDQHSGTTGRAKTRRGWQMIVKLSSK